MMLTASLLLAGAPAQAEEHDEVPLFEQMQQAFANEDLPRARQLLYALQQRGGAMPVDRWNSGLLHKAIHVGGRIRPQLVALLLEAGLDPNAAGWEGATPLHMAARARCAACVLLLVRAGARVDARNEGGETPLHEAGGAVIEALLAAGADPLARDRDGNVPLHRTFHAGLLGAGVDVRNRDGLTPLHAAALDDAPGRLRRLLARGADPAARTVRASHWRAAHMSFAFGRGDAVPAGATALELARERQHASQWSRQSHADTVATLAPVSPAPRSWWKFW